MRFNFANSRWSIAIMLTVIHTSVGRAQAVAPAVSTNPPELAGLYRLEVPATVAPSTITFLRLLPNGRSRVETLHIDPHAARIRATVKVEPFSHRPWKLKEVSPGRSPQFCFALREVESCSAFHVEGPRSDLLLFGPNANWGSPTLILRREQETPRQGP